MDRIDYSKVDPWVKKNPKERYEVFLKQNPKTPLSRWTFAKRRALILGLPMSPSMKPGYRPKVSSKGGSDDEGMFVDRRSRSSYTTVYTLPLNDLKKKNGIQAAGEIIAAMNRIFRLHLESAQVEVIGSGIQNFEIRRYSR
jgi:hypothetical protein